MYKNLNTGAIGVKADLAQTIQYAAAHGFAGIDFSISEAMTLAEENGVAGVQALFADAGVLPGSFGFPVNFRQDEATWQEGLAALPAQVELAVSLGCLRTATWIMPGDNDRPFRENFDFHVSRLRPGAQILADHGIRFGLEFVGPRTLRDSRTHPFVYSIDGMLALCAAIGTGNMGLLVDLFHIFTSHGANEDVHRLTNQDVVTVHINDGFAGRGPDEQIDNQRALPAETGVTDIAGFLQALVAIGYDGPVTIEPFSQRLREMAPAQAVAETAAAMQASWDLAGI